MGSHLGQTRLRGQVLVVDLPQEPPLVVLVHLSGAEEQRGPAAALPACRPPLKPSLPAAEEVQAAAASLQEGGSVGSVPGQRDLTPALSSPPSLPEIRRAEGTEPPHRSCHTSGAPAATPPSTAAVLPRLDTAAQRGSSALIAAPNDGLVGGDAAAALWAPRAAQ